MNEWRCPPVVTSDCYVRCSYYPGVVQFVHSSSIMRMDFEEDR